MNWKLTFAVLPLLTASFLTGCGGYQELPYTGGNPYGYAPSTPLPPGYVQPPAAPGGNYGQAWDATGQQNPGQASADQTTQQTPGTQSPPASGQTQTGTSGTSEVAGDYPSGIPVSGKPGFVTSPYSDDGSQINVQGYPSGTPVRDPYTGGIFIVP